MIDLQSMWSGFDSLLIVLYFVGIVAVGVYMKKRAGKNMKSFFVAGRRLTIPILIGVGAASWEDSWSIVGMAECGTTMGICILFIYLIPTTIMKLPMALWIGPLVRDKIPDWVITMPDLMAYLYDKKTKFTMAIGILPTMMYEAVLLTAGGQVIAYVTGINMWISFAVLGVICIIYTSLSGLWGLAVTDLIQFVIMTVAAGVLCFGIFSYFNGFGEMFQIVGKINPDFVTIDGGNGPMEIIAWLVSAVSIYANAQSYQRFGSAKTGADLKVAYTFIVLFGQFFATIMMIAGIAATAMFPDMAAESPSGAFWSVVFTTLPPGLRGLFVAALLSAVMSTVSADYLVGGAAIARDLVKGFIKPDMSDRGEVLGTRISIWIIGLAMIFCTYFWQDGIAKAWYYLGGFQVASFMIPLLLGLFYKKKTAAAGFWSMTLTILMYALWEFVLECPYGIPSNLSCIIFNVVVYLVVAKLTYKESNAVTSV